MNAGQDRNIFLFTLYNCIEINLLLSLQPHNQFRLKYNATAKSKDKMDRWKSFILSIEFIQYNGDDFSSH